MSEKIIHQIPHSRERNYYYLPFEVKDDGSKLTISYEYSKENACVDIGLMDQEGRFLGWSGSSRSTIWVSEYDSTPGYLMAPIKKGMWQIIVGAYHIPNNGLEVTYSIEVSKEEDLWLKCDLHMHSTASDGQYSIYELAQRAKKIGLDVISVTDHNNWSENLNLPKLSDLVIIPGVEWTHYNGHMNFWGIVEAFHGSFVANTQGEMESVVKGAIRDGALVSVNHPKCNLCPYLWSNEELFSTVEVWNGPMRGVNERGIEYFFSLLDKRRVALVGGSDFHRDKGFVKMGNPTTVVHTPSRRINDILKSIKMGNSYITSSPKGPFLKLDSSSKSFGDSVNGPARFIATAEKLPPFSTLEVVFSSGKTIKKASRGGKVQIEGIANKGERIHLITYISLFSKRYITAISNPMWFV